MGLFDGLKNVGRDGDGDGGGGGGGGGREEEGTAYVRIQNRSSHPIRITFLDVRNIDESNLDDVSGDVGVDSSLPRDDGGGGAAGKRPFANECCYVPLLPGKDGGGGTFFDSGGGGGSVTVEARVPGAHKPTSTLRLIARGDGEWGWEDETLDENSPIILVADGSEVEAGGEGCHRRFRWKVELRVYDNVDTTRWMEVLGERVIGDVPFNQIGLPGTHDSGTYAFDREMGASPDSDLTRTIERFCPPLLGGLADAILDNVFRRLCQCQSKSILDQLRAGVRYLDLRIARHAESGRYYTCHGVYCAEMSAVMGEVRTFLANHRKEIVILDFNHLYEMDGHHVDFLGMVFGILGDVAASPRTTSAASNVSEFWNRKKQAMVIYHASSDVYKGEPFADRVYHNGYIHSPWPEANDTPLLRSKLGGYVESRYDDDGHKNRLFVLQGMLTPDVELIKNGLMRGDGLSIRAYAKLASPAVLDWCTEEWMTMTTGGGDGGRMLVADAAAAAAAGRRMAMMPPRGRRIRRRRSDGC